MHSCYYYWETTEMCVLLYDYGSSFDTIVWLFLHAQLVLPFLNLWDWVNFVPNQHAPPRKKSQISWGHYQNVRLAPRLSPVPPRSRGELGVGCPVCTGQLAMFVGAEVYSHRCLQLTPTITDQGSPEDILLATVVCLRILWCTQILYWWCYLIWWLLTSDKNIIISSRYL